MNTPYMLYEYLTMLFQLHINMYSIKWEMNIKKDGE